MPSLKRLLAVMGTIVALTALAPVASAGSSHDFHLDKTCADSSEPLGYVCTVEHSDFKWIPAGTEIHYAPGPADNAQIATIEIRNGSTTGVCTWSSDVDAICVFDAGTGRLSQFKLDVVVTASADQSIWYWDGTYAFGDDSREQRNAETTFTKWITGPGPAPIVASMAGVVGGDVGAGTFAGEVLTLVDNPLPDGTRVIDAVYHFNGAQHSFTALMRVVATGHATGDTAVLTGRVTEGWLKGNLVSAEYTQVNCTHGGVTGTCFQGTLEILRGTRTAD